MGTFSIVVAVDEERGIGIGGQLPWHIPADMAHFRRLTSEAPAGSRNAVIMGRVTWESIPDKFRPLRDRTNVVLSRRGVEVPAGVTLVGSLEAALAAAGPAASVFVIGGAAIYEQAVAREDCEKLYITRVQGRHGCDVFFPEWEPQFSLADTLEEGTSGEHHYRVEVWTRA